MNRSYYLQRLEDISLLKHSIKINDSNLAVPIRGKRKSGYICVYRKSSISKTIKNLKNHHLQFGGFPNLRIYKGKLYRQNKKTLKLYPAYCIEFGKKVNNIKNTKDMGRMYGYKESVLF